MAGGDYDEPHFAETGEPLAIFPDGIIQGIRVAASNALAARFLAREDFDCRNPRFGLAGARSSHRSLTIQLTP